MKKKRHANSRATTRTIAQGELNHWPFSAAESTPCQNNSPSEANHAYHSEGHDDRVYHYPVNDIESYGSKENSQPGMSEGIPLETYLSGFQVNNKRTLSQRSCDNSSHAVGPPTKKSIKDSTQRLRCPHPGCKLTFPRKWELQRHENGVHNPQISIFCPVYGCKRVDKPFPRADKFMEHMRKHSNMYQYLCMFNTCDVSPRTKEELFEHLNAQHQRDCCSKTEKISLDSLAWRQTALSDGSLLFESKQSCPLAFLGCKYSEAIGTFGKGPWEEPTKDMQHLRSHDLIDLSKAFEAIEQIMGSSYWFCGLATCPICQDKFSYTQVELPRHLQEHSKKDRMSKATDLAEIFRPCLAGKVEWGYYYPANFLPMIKAELEEAGVIPNAVR